GLYKSMPWTTGFCIVGAASISAFPLFSGFISKALIISAAADEGHVVVWLVLLFASAGVFHHSGIKIPYFAFFAHDSGKRPKEAPTHMLLAMGITAALCILIGIFPGPLYALLPYDVVYHPYSMAHVVGQLQLLCFALLAFAVLMRRGIHPPEIRAVNLDTDWTYRRLLPGILAAVSALTARLWAAQSAFVQSGIARMIERMHHSTGPEGRMARAWPTGAMVMWIAILLGVTLIVNFLS
ncbi:MAG TPA: proton-conducting transporter membrane subunit, partial [Paracoccaceae bacterium]|nr:proton-conducting transporter membrane subunit [Paracoccaceae bacterium]